MRVQSVKTSLRCTFRLISILKKEHETANEFKMAFPDVRFVDLHSSYRSVVAPVIRFCDVIAKDSVNRNYSVTVLVPQFVPKKPWQNILHNQTSFRLRQALGSRENIIVATYSYHLKKVSSETFFRS